jgi:hypothetical protein
LFGVPLGHQAIAAEAAIQVAQSDVPDDISALLPLLMSSPERKQLAADLEAWIRQGNLESAERQLNGAIETGTLAIVLVDRLRDPNFLAALQALGIKGADHPASAPDSPVQNKQDAVCTLPEGSATTNASKLQEALEREQARGDAVAWELATLTDEFRTLQSNRETNTTSASSKNTNLQDALQKERNRGDSATHELASVREELSTLQALRTQDATAQADAAELKATLAQERERSSAASRELAVVKKDLQSLQSTRELDATSMAAKAAELQDALQRERGRGDTAARELASAREDLTAVQALRKRDAVAGTSSLTEVKEALTQERVRGNAMTRELAGIIDELRAHRDLRQGGAAPFMFRLEANGAPSPMATKFDLQAAGQPVLVAGTTPSFSDANQTAPNGIRAPAPVRVSSAGDTPVPIIGQEPPPPDTSGSDHAAVSPSPAPGSSKVEGASAQVTVDDRLVTRADALLRTGDVSGARLLLERSMETGNARAAFLLAETFDPHVLSKLGALGIRSDAVKARELYARALALGIRQADERMQALK